MMVYGFHSFVVLRFGFNYILIEAIKKVFGDCARVLAILNPLKIIRLVLNLISLIIFLKLNINMNKYCSN